MWLRVKWLVAMDCCSDSPCDLQSSVTPCETQVYLFASAVLRAFEEERATLQISACCARGVQLLSLHSGHTPYPQAARRLVRATDAVIVTFFDIFPL